MSTQPIEAFPQKQIIRGKKRRNLERTATIAFLVLPGLILFILFLVFPIVQSAYYSLFKWNGLGPLDDFAGIENYVRVLSHSIFHKALWHSLVIVILSLLIQLPFALILALLLGRGQVYGKRLFRAVFFIPFVFSEIITAIIFLYVYHPNDGLVNTVLSSIIPGFDNQAWLANQDTVLVAIFAVITWKFFGYHMILYMAGLQGIPNNIEDAARLDGASEGQVLRHITLPMLGPTIRLTVFLAVLGSLQQFILIWILTEGGPVNGSEVIVTYLFKFGIQRMSLGYGSAVAVVLFVITLIFSLGYQRAIMQQDYAPK